MDKVKDILKEYYGYKNFRSNQREIIDDIITGNDVMAIMPTGGGKSICYQIPAMILSGITIVVSPLISLMKDQVDAINNIGINSAYINSSLSTMEINQIFSKVKEDNIKILYVAPERLESNDFLNLIAQIEVSQIAIDEAHCVSQWGHDFRSSYKHIASFIRLLEKRPVVSAFTATATKEVREDIVRLLELKDPRVFISSFDRENLKIVIEKSVDKRRYLTDYLRNNKESGIIYCATRKEVDSLYELLKLQNISCTRYHAGISDNERKVNQEDFVYDRVSVMIATNAFGMGIDKPNIRFVIHYNMPKNIEGYYQEIGRAGRDSNESECILLFSSSDVQVQRYMIDSSLNSPIRKSNELSKLQNMIDLVYFNGCYRKFILNYFGEERKEDCNNCSNCEFTGEVTDKTVEAQKVISCVYRMKRPYGMGMIIDVLRGSKNKKLLDLALDELSTYGIMQEVSKEELKNFINTLISQGYINCVGTYPVIQLNEKSFELLKGNERIVLKEKIKVEKFFEENELFEILKALRSEIASKEGVPPYIVFGDGTLKEMSIRMPVNESQLLDISGVGEKKLDTYGKGFLQSIKDYVDKNDLKVEFHYSEGQSIKRTSSKKPSYEVTIDCIKENKSILETAKERNIAVSTVIAHINNYISEENKVDFEVDFSSLFSQEEEKQVMQVIEKIGCNKLKPIKEALPYTITYDIIKYVILKYTMNISK